MPKSIADAARRYHASAFRKTWPLVIRDILDTAEGRIQKQGRSSNGESSGF